MTDIPAGWYDDPEHPTQFRYWDGERWTEHRSPKAHAGGGTGADDGVWGAVTATFQLIGQGWRELAVFALPLIAITIVAGALAYASLDRAVEPSLGDIIDRVSEPGFDPVNDQRDEDFIDSIELSVDAGTVAGLGIALLAFTIGGMIATFAVTVFLASLRAGRALSISQTYRVTLRRLPRIIGISLLWGLVGAIALTLLVLVGVIAAIISPWTLLLYIPALLAGLIYVWPIAALAPTTLVLAPSDRPPLRRTIGLVRPQWGYLALRILVLTIVFGGVGFAASFITGPLSAVSLLAGITASFLVQAVQSILGAAGNVVLYDLARGPLDPEIGLPDAATAP